MGKQRRAEASRLRQEIQQVHAEVGEHLEALLAKRALLRGSLYRWQRKCGAETCRCVRGEPHTNWVYSRRRDGRLEKVVLAAHEVAGYQAPVEAYRAFRAQRAALAKAQARLRELLKGLEEALLIAEPGRKASRR
jgi:hypothetical protein